MFVAQLDEINFTCSCFHIEAGPGGSGDFDQQVLFGLEIVVDLVWSGLLWPRDLAQLFWSGNYLETFI